MDDRPSDRHAKSWEMLRREFPEVRTGIDVEAVSCGPGEARVVIDLDRWRMPELDVYVHDQQVRTPNVPIRLELVHYTPFDAARAALEVVTRYQGMLHRRNHASLHPVFDEIAMIHRALHDLGKPLVEADYYHALDTWQWVLRVEPGASLALQVAALFHDVERLVSEADRRVEQHALDYARFKQSHARKGAALVAASLRRLVTPTELRRIVWLVARHERVADDPEIGTLNDADALSFFSLNSRGYLDYFGPAQTRKKVEYTLRRLRAGERWRLAWMRMPAAVKAMIRASGGQHALGPRRRSLDTREELGREGGEKR